MEYPVLDARATGARIRQLRKENHLTVEQVARFMGFESEQAVYKWQRGDSLPTVDNLYALAKLFGTTVDDILMGTRERDESLSSFFVWICKLQVKSKRKRTCIKNSDKTKPMVYMKQECKWLY